MGRKSIQQAATQSSLNVSVSLNQTWLVVGGRWYPASLAVRWVGGGTHHTRPIDNRTPLIPRRVVGRLPTRIGMKRALKAEQLNYHPDRCSPSGTVTKEEVSKMLNRLSETLREDDVGKLGSALKKARHEAESAKQSEKAALERGLQLEKEREALSAEVEKLKSTRQPDTSSSACRGGQAGHSTAVAELVRCFHDTGKISTFAMSRALATMEAFKQIKTVESSKPPVRIAVFTPSGYRLDAAATNNALDNLADDL